MDDDLQHPVSEIEPLLAALDADTDVVYGAPLTQQHGLLRDLASYLTKLALSSAMGAGDGQERECIPGVPHPAARGLSGLSEPLGIDRRAADVGDDTILDSARYACSARSGVCPGTRSGSSSLTRSTLMTGFSTMPLQIASLIGFAFVLLGMLVMAYVLVGYLIHGAAVPGFAFLASIITIFSGAQLFALGVFGEYLARMHFRSMDRPVYVIREIAGADAAPDLRSSAQAHALGRSDG
jgi:hypothetical protein